MGASQGEFTKYPRTPHLFGSKGTDDDKQLSEAESLRFIADPSLIIEEKVDGTNVGIHFDREGELVLQCRGHLITEGMHPQYDLFKQWATVKRPMLRELLQDRYLLFGEWLYARHTIHYRQLPHYFFEFDIYDKEQSQFLTLPKRLNMLDGTGLQTVPVLHTGAIARSDLTKLIVASQFDSRFEHPDSGRWDNLMEGLYLRIEQSEVVVGRSKFVRIEFTEKIKQSEHWQSRKMEKNLLTDDADIWS